MSARAWRRRRHYLWHRRNHQWEQWVLMSRKDFDQAMEWVVKNSDYLLRQEPREQADYIAVK